MTAPVLVFLLDVDNTLLDNDRLKEDISAAIERLAGPERTELFWQVYEEVRAEEDYVDYPTAVERWSLRLHDRELGERLMTVLDRFPFTQYVYPHVMETIRYLRTLGTVAILSDGDSVFQPLKIRASGLEAAVGGHVMIYVHKEKELPDIFTRYPADHYVMVDDKPRILSRLEELCPSTFTTVLVLQGKYAASGPTVPLPDIVLPVFADLRELDREQFLVAESKPPLDPESPQDEDCHPTAGEVGE